MLNEPADPDPVHPQRARRGDRRRRSASPTCARIILRAAGAALPAPARHGRSSSISAGSTGPARSARSTAAGIGPSSTSSEETVWTSATGRCTALRRSRAGQRGERRRRRPDRRMGAPALAAPPAGGDYRGGLNCVECRVRRRIDLDVGVDLLGFAADQAAPEEQEQDDEHGDQQDDRRGRRAAAAAAIGGDDRFSFMSAISSTPQAHCRASTPASRRLFRLRWRSPRP